MCSHIYETLRYSERRGDTVYIALYIRCKNCGLKKRLAEYLVRRCGDKIVVSTL